LTSANGVAQSVDHASGVGSTGGGVAWVRFFNTTLVLTNKATFTIRIPGALRSASSDGVWFGDKSLLTSANGVAQAVDHASRVGTTGGGVAWVRLLHTSLVLAHISILTVGIPNTFGATAGDGVRLRYQPSLTPANWVSILVDHASGPWSTRGWVAWVWLFDTALVLTDKAPVAVRVPDTLGATAGDGVRFGDEVGNAPADSIAVGALLAGGVRAAWGGLAGVLGPGRWTGLGSSKIEVLSVRGLQ